MYMIRRRLLPALLLAALLPWGGPALAAPPGVVDTGAMLREARMRGLNGPDRALSSYRGKPLLINVWASWCGPCRMEMASVERLAWRDQGQRFHVIGISTDDSEAAAKRFLQQSNATLNHYRDQALELETMLGADRLPLTVLVDTRGRVLGKFYGARAWDGAQAQAWIDGLLSAKE